MFGDWIQKNRCRALSLQVRGIAKRPISHNVNPHLSQCEYSHLTLAILKVVQFGDFLTFACKSKHSISICLYVSSVLFYVMCSFFKVNTYTLFHVKFMFIVVKPYQCYDSTNRNYSANIKKCHNTNFYIFLLDLK